MTIKFMCPVLIILFFSIMENTVSEDVSMIEQVSMPLCIIIDYNIVEST